MNRTRALIVLIAWGWLAAPAVAGEAGIAGDWRVTGKVSAFSFTLDCHFEPRGGQLGGACIDASINDPKIHPGRVHPLTAGAVDGTAVTWTYQSSFLLTRFDVTFSGARAGDRMGGTINASGRKGVFQAARE